MAMYSPTLKRFIMRIRLLPLVTLALACTFASLAQAEVPVKTADGILVTSTGMTLYTFDKDTPNKSTCNGPCATQWPPAMAAAGAKPEGDMSIVMRDDGARQWAYMGKPVYLYAKDKNPGDKTGDNFKDIWHVIKK